MNKVLIVDIDISEHFHSRFENLGLEVFDARMLTEKLFSKKDFWEKFDPENSILVFPGNGASIVRGYIPERWLNKWPQTQRVHAKRYWQPGDDPQVIANRIYPEVMTFGIKDVVVLDDVASSGKTARLLREKNIIWIPGSTWHIAAWVMQESVSLKGYASKCTVKSFGTKNKKVPINSLSTLTKNGQIAASYAARNFPKCPEFLSLLKEVKNQIN